MTRTWTTPIYDRTYGDIQSVQLDPEQTNPKGCWNALDLNRIEKNTAYCAEWMYVNKIVRTPPEITVRENDYWTSDMIPIKSEIDRIIGNVRLLVELSSTNPAIANRLPTIYTATQPNYILVNQIEYALDLMHNQPRLPSDYFKVFITNGIIKSITKVDGSVEIVESSEALIAEDEIVTIKGVEYGEDAQYQIFSNWSGTAADIGLLNDYQSQETTFEMPYGREIRFTANFETHIPRTLTLENGYISVDKDPTAETGPTTKQCYAGDEIMIIADIAEFGKAFYEWTGTEEALQYIVGVTDVEDPSTAILTMPDCDVELRPHYINAGQHSVTVRDGSGSGWYNYKDYVSIYANTLDRYIFSHWSGDTNYLTDIYSPSQSFRMEDMNIYFRAHYNYVYSYNTVQMIDGLIQLDENTAVDKADNLKETDTYTLVPTPPNNTLGLDYWSVEGAGRVYTDSLGNHTNTFEIGDGNSIITGHYNTLRNVIMENLSNDGKSITSQIVQGHKLRVQTQEVVGDYIFTNWSVNGTDILIGTTYDITIPENDVIIRANYRLRNQVQVTIDYGNHSEIVTMQERSTKTIVADTNPEGVKFARWASSNLYRIDNINSATTSFAAGETDGSISAVYENYHMLTVNAGDGSGIVLENAEQVIDATQAPSTYEFDYWEINSGDGTIANIYSKKTTFRMGTTDAEITAHYKPIPYFTVTIENGYVLDHSNNWVGTAMLLRNATNPIKMKPAPTGKQFLQWEVYENGILQTDANDIEQSLAETTRFRDLLRSITVKAVYYIPDPSVKYTLTINRKDGTTNINEYAAGTDIPISASYPEQGYEFWRWSGDTTYILGGVTNPDSYVHMPAQNIQITENYQPEGYIPEYKIDMTNIYGQCCYETTYEDPETHETTVTEHWVSTYEHYKQEDVVKIRATGFDAEHYFHIWNAYNHDTEEDARSVITKLYEPQTTLIMPDYDLDIDPSILPKQTHELQVIDGGTSGYYYSGKRADVYFNKISDNNIHYDFTRWRGGTGTDLTKLELFDGGMFDVRTPGTSEEPQFIKMPEQSIEIIAVYKTLYRLELTNGTINDESITKNYYESNTTVYITADPAPTGMRFQYWEGNTDVLENKYDPTTVLTTTNRATELRAVYSTDADRNNIGYTTLDLKSSNEINNTNVSVIAGEIDVGFILTDINGHIYIVTSVNTQTGTSTIYRMTKTKKGGTIYD